MPPGRGPQTVREHRQQCPGRGLSRSESVSSLSRGSLAERNCALTIRGGRSTAAATACFAPEVHPNLLPQIDFKASADSQAKGTPINLNTIVSPKVRDAVRICLRYWPRI